MKRDSDFDARFFFRKFHNLLTHVDFLFSPSKSYMYIFRERKIRNILFSFIEEFFSVYLFFFIALFL